MQEIQEFLLAIFFWILKGGVEEVWTRCLRWQLAIFFWILTTCTRFWRKDSRIDLLFSFEFWMSMWLSRRSLTRSCCLAIFFWILIELKRFIEKCPEIRSLAIFFWILIAGNLWYEGFYKWIPWLAIFFWILIVVEEEWDHAHGYPDTCYFLLNFELSTTTSTASPNGPG